MAWFDWLQEVPLSKVQQERLALAEDRVAAIERENVALREQVTAWKTKCSDLEGRLAAQASEAAFFKQNGLLWLKDASGAFEPAPYCPKCETPMHAFPPYGRAMVWVCSACELTVNHSAAPTS